MDKLTKEDVKLARKWRKRELEEMEYERAMERLLVEGECFRVEEEERKKGEVERGRKAEGWAWTILGILIGYLVMR
jgi:hypothetical protein